MHITRTVAHLQRRLVGAEMDIKEYLKLQALEIERHKWIESEKAGKDLGMDAAIDWILKYADTFSDDFPETKSIDTAPDSPANFPETALSRK
jgi:hypothetical protein